jgi:hypothetical protein
MAVQTSNIGIVKNNLQLYYNREWPKSFRGEATTNIVSNTTNFTGSSYAGYENEWTADPTRFTKSYNSALQTPIGTGATLLTESGTAGYYHLSRFGGSGLGGNSISCYVYPVGGVITNFAIGMLADSNSTAIFNLVTGTIVSTGVRVSNAFITKVSGWPGWYRVGANIGGRDGGWVGAVGLDVQTSYTPSSPYKSMYVTGMQYESKTYCTAFVVGSNRSANTVAGGGGLLDMSGNKYSADLNSAAVAFDSGGFYFTGNAAGALTTPVAGSVLDGLSNNSHTYDCWFKLLGTPTGLYDGYFFGRQGFHEGFYHLKNTSNFFGITTWYNDNTPVGLGTTLSLNTCYYGSYVADVENATIKLYINENVVDSGTLTKQLRQYSSTVPYHVGAASVEYAGNCIVSVARAYNRVLTDSEIRQNFNAQRKIYGI